MNMLASARLTRLFVCCIVAVCVVIAFSIPRDTVEINRKPVDADCAC